MKRMVVVLGTLLGTLLTATSPALAQMVAEGLVEVEGAPPPPQYVLAADGTLTMGGDIVLNCNEFARFVEQYGDDPPSDPYLQSELEQARNVVEECERVGFSYSDGTGAGTIGPSGVEDAEGTPVGGVTEDGFVRVSSDTFVACASGFPVVEQYAEACESAGLPQADVQIPEGENDLAGAIARGPGDPPIPDLPDYVLSEDGTVIIGGDTGESCRTFASSIPLGEAFPTSIADAPPDFPLADNFPDFEQARGVLEQCERRGLLPSGGRYAANMPAGGQQTPMTQAELPATGGLGLSSPGAPLASGALLIVLGIAAQRRTS